MDGTLEDATQTLLFGVALVIFVTSVALFAIEPKGQEVVLITDANCEPRVLAPGAPIIYQLEIDIVAEENVLEFRNYFVTAFYELEFIGSRQLTWSEVDLNQKIPKRLLFEVDGDLVGDTCRLGKVTLDVSR
ncbi:MAG: hypothetical protein ACE5KG_02365 [Nitrososphaerales archaeon]